MYQQHRMNGRENFMSMDIEEYAQYHETKLHEQPGFSYNTYLCTIPLDFPRVGLHWHEQMEIIYIKRGRGTVTLNLVPYEVTEGCIVPVLPGELHSIEMLQDAGETGTGRMEYENIIFSLSILDSTDENDWCRNAIIQPLRDGSLRFPRPIRPGSGFHSSVALALDAADDVSRVRAPGYSLIIKSQLFLFLHALYQNREQDAREAQPGQHTGQIKAVLAYVKEHYSEPVTIETAAGISGYSMVHFMRIFKKETGQTFISFLNDYRLTAASCFLKETHDTIGNIAIRCGFDNFSYFIRIFRAKYGKSPKEYRKD